MDPLVNNWITRYILGEDPEKKFTMYWHGQSETSTRPAKAVNNTLTPFADPEDCPVFADGYPYLLLSKESVDGLNANLKAGGRDLVCEPKRFRPNIVVRGEYICHILSFSPQTNGFTHYI